MLEQEVYECTDLGRQVPGRQIEGVYMAFDGDVLGQRGAQAAGLQVIFR